MKSYRVLRTSPDARIEVLEIIKRTDKTVTFKKEAFRWKDTDPVRFIEERENLQTQYHIHFTTLEEAKQYCLERCNKTITAAESTIVKCKARIEELTKLAER